MVIVPLLKRNVSTSGKEMAGKSPRGPVVWGLSQPIVANHSHRRIVLMMQKINLCILGLLILGMCCVPLAAGSEQQGSVYDLTQDWDFYIIDDVRADTSIAVNGTWIPNEDNNYHWVRVPEHCQSVDMEYDVTLGANTKLTITRDMINKLRREYTYDGSGNTSWRPTIHVWGGIRTYDIDAVVFNLSFSHPFEGQPYCFVNPDYIVVDHLVKRGALHENVGERYSVGHYYHRDPDEHWVDKC